MNYSPFHYRAAIQDFHHARQRAVLQAVMARLTGQSAELLNYEDVARQLKLGNRAERGLQEIPLAAIVGTVGRYGDFTRTFLPRHDNDEERWATVKALAADPHRISLPPIEVYQIGEAYFVLDGHHRVSAARQMGLTHLEARVIEIKTTVPLAPDTQPDELILKAEYAEFLEQTRLHTVRPTADLSVSVPGQYAKLLDLITLHRYWLAQAQWRPITPEEALADWYDNDYFPVVQIIRERGLLRDFPNRTETDVYVWVADHHAALEKDLGWEVTPTAAAKDFAARADAHPRGLAEALSLGPAPGQWRSEKLAARYTDRLFADLLVPVNGDEAGWHALDQALIIAHREAAQLHGLFVVADAQKEAEVAEAARAEFNRRCEQAGVSGGLAIEVGGVAATICKRAVLTDLVILNLTHPPPTQPLARLGSGFRALIRHCARPVLAVPGLSSLLDRILLAYDGSPKAKEALFVAAYFAEQWKVALTVLTVAEDSVPPAALDYARAYLEFHEAPAEFLTATGPVSPTILQTAAERQAQLILMGGYGAHPVVEVVLGATVDEVLRGSPGPMLICR